MLHLVRHADAGDRQAWVRDDYSRPLDERGMRQAEAIGVELARLPVKRILSSPAVRCVDTVAPLGRLLDLTVDEVDELGEGSSVRESLRLVKSLAALGADEGDSVLCSHGDVIPGVLWALARQGLAIPDLGRCKKASIWELDVASGRIVRAGYRHPRTFGAA